MATDVAQFVRELAAMVHVRHLMTPISSATGFAADASESAVAAELDDKGFDYAPVLDDGRVLGRIARERLTKSGTEPIATKTEALSPRHLIGASAAISDLVDRLSEERWLFVVERQGIDGIVAVSDLNKQAARTYFFLLVAAYEAELARAIRNHWSDQGEALEVLAERTRRDVTTRYNALQAQNLDIDLVSTMMLGNLETIVRNTPALRARWAVDAPSWRRRTHGIAEFRNRVAHPSRPVLNHDWRLPRLKRRLDALGWLLSDEQTRP